MSRGKSTRYGAHGAMAAKLVQSVADVLGRDRSHRTRVVTTGNGRISDDTLAAVARLVRAGLV